MRGSSRAWRSVALAIAMIGVGCGGDDAVARAPVPATDARPTEPPAAPPATEAPPPPPEAPPPPPCPAAPCAARPLIFVHGYRGSNHDWLAMLDALVATDPRFAAYRLSGTEDHASWPARSIDRKGWLFAFDYYNKRAEDAREAYTAGVGRIGSNRSFSCPSGGSGNLVADDPTYTQDLAHDYAEDLAALVDSVLRATGAASVDVVAHSMGGLVTRSFMAFYGGGAKVERLLLLASPFEGIGPAAVLQYIGVGQQPWMNAHEIAELDGGSVLSQTRFKRCGGADRGPWGKKLLEAELLAPPRTELLVMSGALDLVSYAMSDHPLAKLHEVVDGATHSGILKSDDAIAKVRTAMGGSYP